MLGLNQHIQGSESHSLLYLKRVKIFKHFLVTLAVLSILLIIVLPLRMAFQQKKEHSSFTFPTTHLAKAEGLFLQGEDKEQGLYELKADHALQDFIHKNHIYFHGFYVKLTTIQNEVVILTSKYGYFQKDQQKVFLHEDVHMTHTQGYDFITPKATIDLKDRTIKGNDTLIGHGPIGKIRAKGFQILDKGDRVLLGPAVAGIHQRIMRKDP